VRLMPVTGLPLPLVSLGGSFVISTMISLGILQSIHIRDSAEPRSDRGAGRRSTGFQNPRRRISGGLP
jgi:hypothetical protein